MLRGAIIGLGNVGLEAHLPGWTRQREVEIVAATDVRADRRQEWAARMPGARWYTSAEALLADTQPDFVDICSPPTSHASLVAAALGGGAHVLCEKPLVCSPRDLATVTELAARAGRVLHTVHNWHHAPIVMRTARLVEEGAIGRVARIVWRTVRTAPAAVRGNGESNWRVDPAVGGGGILTDHGWHVFYLIRRWLGDWPTSVAACLETRRHTRWSVEDTADVRITFPEATAEIFLTWAGDARSNWARLEGSEGSIELCDDTVVLSRATGDARWSCPPPLSSGSVHPDWFDGVAREFTDAVTGRAGGGDNLAEASLCVALESLARESSRAGGRALGVPEAVPR